MTRKTTLVSLAATTALTLVGTATAAQASDDEMVTDRLGTHSSSAVDMPPDSSGTNQLYAASSCGTWSEYGGGFNTSLGGGWELLAVRSGPCRAGEATGDGWGTGSRFHVSRETNGEFICRSRLQGIGTAVWFKTDRGFSWSGGTSDARWKSGCN